MKYFLDTNVLLEDIERYSSDLNIFLISSITLEELESLKENRNVSEETKSCVRSAIRWLADNRDKYEVITYCDAGYEHIQDCGFFLIPENPDIMICSCVWIAGHKYPEEVIKFVTSDLSCRNIAENIFGLDVEWFEQKVEETTYTGFREVVMSDEDMAYFYEHQSENIYNLLINQYLIISNSKNEVIDTYKWDGCKHQPLYKKQIKSTYFDKLKPKDIYQSCMADSIMSNTITAISGKPGTGKSLVSLMCAMNLIENGKYDRLVILYNACKTKGAFDMGYYSGNAIEKGLQQFLGQMLATKFGDQYGVELMIQQGKLKIVSLADCRGMEIRDNEILYMTECQNTSVDLIKLALSRVSSGAKVIIEGDYKTQTDSHLFEGNKNGLKRVIESFKGHEEFGYIELQNIWRSKLAELAELL